MFKVGDTVVVKYAGTLDEGEVVKVYGNGECYQIVITTPPYRGNTIVVEADRIVCPKVTKPITPRKENFIKRWVRKWLN